MLHRLKLLNAGVPPIHVDWEATSDTNIGRFLEPGPSLTPLSILLKVNFLCRERNIISQLNAFLIETVDIEFQVCLDLVIFTDFP